ncbi:MAG: tol-pal system protein YbgF [Candidatus Contendobacter sp.]|nr:MAG: tol-pal system protein YbgF [Candidatus Contendobacter sp.]
MTKYGSPWLMALLLGSVLLPGAVRAQHSPDNELTLELLQRIEQLETEVRQIRGELELQRHHIETIARERAMPGSPAYPPASRVEPPPAMPAAAEPPMDARSQPAPAQPSPPASVAAGAERAEFDAALSELREGRYPEAIAAWRRFLSAHPNGGLAGDAQYWLGETYYLSRDYGAAKETFIALGLNHPQSARLPDALLKLGYIYGEQGETARARDVLQKLVQVYPNTQAASLAERRLQSLR